MTWFNPFSQPSELSHRTRQQKDTPLQLEVLEDRHLLSAEPILLDINQIGSSSNPDELTEVNGFIFFSALDGQTGRELWKSDGTEAGTQLVKNIRLDGSSSPEYLTNVNGIFYFRANDGSSGSELWRSDGTEAGTQLVKDIRSGEDGSAPRELKNIDGTLFFLANDRATGYELWKSDGTEAGTQLVKDILSGGLSSTPRELTNVDGTLFFRANDGSVGEELWKSDGTEAGTQLVKDIRSGWRKSSVPRYLANMNGTLFFRADDGSTGEELWRSDGSEAGTQLVKDIRSGGNDSTPRYLTNVNGTLFFSTHDSSTGRELWRSDGTEVGTQLVKDIRSGSGSSPKVLMNMNGTLFFRANNGSTGDELWRSDGTEEGTLLVKDIWAGNSQSSPYYLTNVNGTLFFRAREDSTGIELWMSDGTEAGTQLVKDIWTGNDFYGPHSLTNVNGTLLFVANSETTGTELWRSDETTAGTQVVKDLLTSTLSSGPQELTDVNGTLFFVVNDGLTGTELWRSDGTTIGTQVVKDLRPGTASSFPQFLTNVNGTLYFQAHDGSTGEELWRSDGTEEGTQLVKDIQPGWSDSSLPRYLTNVNGTLFFVARIESTGMELWRSDGTESGTQLVKDIQPGEWNGSYPEYLTDVNGTLFFRANDGSYGLELWMSDGTEAGTQLVKDIRVGGANSSPQFLINMNGTLFFRGNDGSSGRELWMSDGTSEGTQFVKDLSPSSMSSFPRNLTNVNGTLFFQANNGLTGTELWKSDGTSEGTQLVKDIRPNSTSLPQGLTNVNGSFFFVANDGSTGFELWRSDGTSEGTQLVKDIHSGIGHSSSWFLTNVNGTLFFRANDGSTGEELWMSNGTSEGTYLVKDIRTGNNGSFPQYLTNVNGTLFFQAHDGLHGQELWVLEDTEAPTLEITPEGGATNNSPITFTFQFSEFVNNFDETDIIVTGGTKGTFIAVDSDTFTLEVTPSSEGLITVTVADDAAEDFVGNLSLGDSATLDYDIAGPMLEVTANGNATNENPILFTFEFSEDIVGFIESDIVITSGTGSNFTMIDGDTYTLEVTPTSDGETTVTVADGAAEDAAGNLLVGESVTVVYDSISPTVVITPNDNLTNVVMTVFTFEFSEGVSDFTIDAIQVTNGTKGTLTAIDGDTYTLEVNADADGDITVSVADDVAQDAAGNLLIGDSATIEYDGTAPTLEITPDGTITNSEILLFTFEFSEDVTGFTTEDVVVTNGTKGIFSTTDGNTYTLTVTPTADGDVTVTVADMVAQDAAGNDNVGDMATVEYDGTAPAVAVSSDNDLTNMATTVFTFEFSEEVFDFTADDVMVINGSKGTFTMVDGDIYTLQVTAMADGDVIVNALAYGATDAAGNGNQVESATVTYDGTAPTLIITPDSGVTNNTPITFTLEFSEEIVEFIEGDITITGGVGSNFTMVDEDTYTIDVTPDADGDITASVADDVAQDSAGNGNLVEMATIEYDGTAPTLEITPDGGESNDDPILFTFEFSEEVFGFEESDIVVTGGTAGTFTTIDNNTYTLEVTPDEEDGGVTVTVADAVAEDEAGNENVGDSATILYNAIDETSLIVTGTDAGGPATVRVFDPSGNELLSFMPYGAFSGGVRVATGDVNGDGVLDIITAAGPGGGPHVQVFDSRTGQLITGGLNNFYAYAPNVTTGVFVAAGDVNGDGYDDIITAPDSGGGPHLKVYNGLTGNVITEFYTYAPNVTVGVRIATGDINSDGFAEIITTAGPGGGPHVRVINGMTGEQMPGPVTNFYAYAPNVLTGLYVASGDVNGDGFDDIITSPGAGGGPHVQAFSSADGSTLQNFYAYHPNFVGGVRVGSADLNQDGFADIITVPGSSGGPHTRGFSGVDLSDLSNFFSGDPGNTDGLFITGGVSLLPVEDPSPTSAPFSNLLTSDSVNHSNTSKSDTSESVENVNTDTFKPKKSWYDEVDEFYQSSEKIDKLFTGLGIR
ncbi:Hypothetical protein PBC10988_2740 [Planctomycetales bacterium 10988]|nr:Hypothetical protein PBC10988_2740 [Planctomycetales bacterium 10988]